MPRVVEAMIRAADPAIEDSVIADRRLLRRDNILFAPVRRVD